MSRRRSRSDCIDPGLERLRLEVSADQKQKNGKPEGKTINRILPDRADTARK
jgi:hypothetical protein